MAQTSAAFAWHAESEASAARIVNGDPSRPIGLAEAGGEQSRTLGGERGGQDLGLRVVIERPRTRQIADFALADRDVPRLMLCELNDRPCGSVEGRPIAEFSDWLTRPGPGEPLGGESCVRAVLRYARGRRMIIGSSRAAGRRDRARSPGDLHGAGGGDRACDRTEVLLSPPQIIEQEQTDRIPDCLMAELHQLERRAP
jgi:hypothetical protein